MIILALSDAITITDLALTAYERALQSDGVRRNRTQRLPDGGPIVSSPLSSR
jgi:hypothetical protein